MSRRQLEEFKLLDPIGRGTVGTIFHAHDLVNERDVALKVLLPAVSREPVVAARFEREMVILAKLSHPNIVPYYGGGRSGEQLFFAMELMTGGSLKMLLERAGRLTVLEAVTCGIQIASALQHAHNHGVIHRDLKPSNLLFDQDGTLKLVDFGIARDTHEADITSDGLTVGTYAYMAPEQIQGKREITGQVDLYSFGCVFFEMLSGRPPFQGDNFAQLLEQHLHRDPPSLRDIDSAIPPELEELAQRLLQKAAEHRPVNARSAQGTLMQFADTQSPPQAAGRDVPAAAVIDRAKEGLARRLKKVPGHEFSWWAIAGVCAVALLIVLLAKSLGG